MSVLTCTSCLKRPTRDGLALCTQCQTTTKVGITNVGIYHADLFSIGSGRVKLRRGGNVPDPTGFSAAIGEHVEADAPDALAAETRNALVGWVRDLDYDRPGGPQPHDTVASMAAWLAARTGSIATLLWAGDYARGVIALERRLRKVVERGKGRWYAGICSHVITEATEDAAAVECPCDLYAVPGSTDVRCPSCRTTHSVHDRRAVLINAARDELLPISVIAAAAVTLLGDEPSVARLEARLRQWAKRGDIKSYGTKVIAGQERRVYGMGEVLDVLTSAAARSMS